MRKPAILVIFLLIIIGLSLFIYLNKFRPAKEVHYHAGFQVYKDDKLLDFSESIYMSLVPCDNDPNKGTYEYEQLQKAHLHDNVGDVVHVHRAGATWRDLFNNINFKFNQSPRGFINGKEFNDVFSEKIKPYDSVVLFVGKTSDTGSHLKKAVTKEHITETEKKSRDCGVAEEH